MVKSIQDVVLTNPVKHSEEQHTEVAKLSKTSQELKLATFSSLFSSIESSLNIDKANIYDMTNHIKSIDDQSLVKPTELNTHLDETISSPLWMEFITMPLVKYIIKPNYFDKYTIRKL